MAYALGDQTFGVEESAKRGLTLSPSEVLKDAGFSQHSIASANLSAYQLAYQSVKKLEDPQLKDVDAIVYATCIPVNSNVGSSEKATASRDVKHLMDYPGSHLQADFAMDKAILFGLTQQACTGLLGGLRLAKMLIETEPTIKKVLCLTADRFPEGALYEQAYNLICDGAAAAMVEADAEGYEIQTCHQITNGAMAQASDDETVGHFFNYTSRLVQETLARNESRMPDIRWIVPQNTNSKAWQILGRVLGFPFEKVALKTLASVGHMISGDNIVNLLALDQAGEIKTGDKLLLLMAGYGLNWQSIILQKTGGLK